MNLWSAKIPPLNCLNVLVVAGLFNAAPGRCNIFSVVTMSRRRWPTNSSTSWMRNVELPCECLQG